MTIKFVFVFLCGHFLSIGVNGSTFTSGECIEACRDTTSSSSLRKKCYACTEDPPLNYHLCSNVCVNTLSNPLVKLCNKCGTNVPLTDLMCITACGKTYDRNFKKICIRCGNAPPETPLMILHSCFKKPPTTYLDTICDAICSKSPSPGTGLCVLVNLANSTP
jgi:hypothetical protein